MLQNNKQAAGSVTRISAPELEAAVVTAVRSHLGRDAPANDRELVEKHVRSVVLIQGRLVIEVYNAAISYREINSRAFGADADAISSKLDEALDPADHDSGDRPLHRLSIPWTPRDVHRAKGVRDDGRPGLSDAARDQLLRAIAKARRWMQEVSLDVTTFADIASKEGCVERHVRFLASLAYLSPAIIEAIADGRVPAELTISSLARALPKDWATQDSRIFG